MKALLFSYLEGDLCGKGKKFNFDGTPELGIDFFSLVSWLSFDQGHEVNKKNFYSMKKAKSLYLAIFMAGTLWTPLAAQELRVRALNPEQTTRYAREITDAGSLAGYLYVLPQGSISDFEDCEMTPQQQRLRALALYRMGRKSAFRCIEQSLQDPSRPLGQSELLLAKATRQLGEGEYVGASRTLLNINELTLSVTERTEWQVKLAYALEAQNGGQPRTRQLFEQAAKEDNRWGKMAQLYLASILLAEQRIDEAEKLYQQLSAVSSPFATEAAAGLAAISYFRGDYELAIRQVKQAEQHLSAGQEPLPQSLHIAGNAYYRLHQPEQTINYLERLRTLAPQEVSAEDYLVLGAAYVETKCYQEAVQPLLQATSTHNPLTSGAANLYLGRTRRELGLFSQAVASFEAASEKDVPNAVREEAMYEMALLLRSSGQGIFGQEVRITEEFLNQFPHSKHSEAMTRFLREFYLSNKDYTSSLNSLNRIKQPSKELLSAKKYVLNRMALRSLQEGNLQQARDFVAQSSRVSVSEVAFDKELLLIRSEINLRQQEYDEVIEDLLAYLNYNALAEDEANRTMARYNLGYALFGKKNYAAALKQFTVAANGKTLDSEQLADTYARIGDCNYMASRFAMAAEAYGKAYQGAPENNVYALYMLATIEGLKKDYHRQVNSLVGLIEKHPQSSYVPNAYFEAGRASVFLNKSEEAKRYFSTLMNRFPQSEYSRLGALQLALTHYNSGDTQKAIDLYLGVIKTAPQSEEARQAFNSLKSIYIEENRSDEFIALSKELGGSFALKDQESRSISFKGAEQAYYSKRKDAATLLEKFIASHSETPEALQARFYLADLYYGVKDYDRALELYRELIARKSSLEQNRQKQLLQRAGELYTLSSEHTHALNCYLSLLQLPLEPSSKAEAYYNAALSSWELKNMEQCVQLAQSGQKETQKEDPIYRKLILTEGKGQTALGQKKQAIEVFSKLDKQLSTVEGTEAAVLRASLYLQSDSQKKLAMQLMERVIQNGSESPYWLARSILTLSDYYISIKELATARQYLLSLQKNYTDAEPDIRQMLQERLTQTEPKK